MMGPAAEREMAVRRPGQVEPVRVGELVRVPVGRGQPQHHTVTAADPLPADHRVLARGPYQVRGAGRPPQDLVLRRVLSWIGWGSHCSLIHVSDLRQPGAAL
ncbi:hypothetical protein STRIP9103_02371 [Streptomyces ipomoeae 91-03]|uniref:Uncharacterized protein n=1 Tax=Streptomyces ipomoeae 91-03 TaxID=698759 RepID=L1L0F6_9ACTN|nr:hypothetical protein STRIP9103_02371 [Streptomyces ipomoeae 91-03]